MPYSASDVMNMLGESTVQQLNFWVGSVHITGKWFGIIRDHIFAENIVVTSGSSSLAFYDQTTDVLTTQAGSPPASFNAKALLLHECVHALVDIFYPDDRITRHNDELAAYITQYVYLLRTKPSFTVAPNNVPWFTFFTEIVDLAKRFNLDKPSDNGARISAADLEPVRRKLAALPGVNYGEFDKWDTGGSNGLIGNPFLAKGVDAISGSRATFVDPSDDYLIRKLNEQYGGNDVQGYGGRLRTLRRDFALCSLARVNLLKPRLAARTRGDRVSELFYDRLSGGGRALLLRVLQARS
jgi:hypothetical protein